MKRRRLSLGGACMAALSLASAAAAQAPERRKLPRPVEMDAGVETIRNAATGELVLRPVKEGATRGASSSPVLRVEVNLVEVTCNVLAPDGTALRALAENNFQVFEDGREQQIEHFDSSSEGASVALVIDASPSVLPDSQAMKAAAQELIAGLSPADQVAVIDFAEHTFLLLPFSRDRRLLAKAVAGVDVRSLFSDTIGSNIYRSLYLAANEIFPGRTGRKAIVLLTDGQDSGLGLNLDGEGVAPRPGEHRATFQDVVQALSAQGIEVYAISTQNRPPIMTANWLAAHQAVSLISPAALTLGIPAYTDFLAELVRRVGGQLYFLKEEGSIAGAYRSVVQNLNAQYTLGYYPPSGRKPGWHSLRVVVDGHGPVRVVHRLAYYQPAGN
jgi:Ca-activated chloride channel homolog